MTMPVRLLVDGVVAQLVERLVRNEKVAGSIPVGSTIHLPAQIFTKALQTKGNIHVLPRAIKGVHRKLTGSFWEFFLEKSGTKWHHRNH